MIKSPLADASTALSILIDIYYAEIKKTMPPYGGGEFYIPDDYFEKYDADFLKKEYYEVKKKYDEWANSIQEYLKKHPFTDL